MKKFYVSTFVLLLVMVNFAVCQWTQLVTPNSLAELRSSYFLNSSTGFVVGSDGIMIKTIDAGANWTIVNSSTTDTLRSIYFTDDTTGYAVGAQGRIIKTIDGGASWSQQVSGNTSLLRSVHFPTHETGYTAGGNGVILKTIDGGANWVPQTSGTAQDLISVRFTSADTGFAVSSLSTFYSGIILKTVDGGTNWNTVYTDTMGFLCVFPYNNDTVYAVGGSGRIVKSIDGGTNWNMLSSGDTNRLRAVFFITADTGWVAGELGNVFYTSDGGSTWTSQYLQVSGMLGLYFPTHDTGYAVGIAGTVLRYATPCILATQPVQIFGGTTVCEASSQTYYIAPVSGATSYTWTVPAGSTITAGQGDTVVTVTFGNTSGLIAVTADNQCGASPVLNLLVSVNPLPAVPVITASGIYLQSTVSTAYQWYFNGSVITGADSSVFIPLTNGSYTVVVTNSFGCTATSSPFTVINAGIESLPGSSMLIYPQPSSGYFTVSWDENDSSVKDKILIIMSAEGKVWKQIIIPTGRETIIATQGLSAGTYFYALLIKNKIAARGLLLTE